VESPATEEMKEKAHRVLSEWRHLDFLEPYFGCFCYL
jgi:hypothetical protein